jgi:hypothetical protein
MASRVITALLMFGGVLGCEEKMYEPRYAERNQLLRPEGYREWVFVGADLGMGYGEGQASKTASFHNIYIQPEAYRRFAATGQFPDKTILVMEKVSAGANASINRRGQFEDHFQGIEAAVKDENRFPEKWAYFDFIGTGPAPLPKARPFPKEACWKCHNEHGAVDNVFVQFYPVLREARQRE